MHDTITGPVFQGDADLRRGLDRQGKTEHQRSQRFPVPGRRHGHQYEPDHARRGAGAAKRSPATVDLASSITASALLRGARGNSGVILSLLFRGMSKSLKGCVTADGCTFAAAMQEGVSAAYNAVMKPAEGTILTVSRLAADRAMAASAEKTVWSTLLSRPSHRARRRCARPWT